MNEPAKQTGTEPQTERLAVSLETNSGPSAARSPTARPGFFHRAVMYPGRYAWYVLASTLDITVTVLLLTHLGFREANSFAQKSIDYFGTWGLIGLKFMSVIIVVAICEYVGRQKESLGRLVATIAIFASLFPVLFAVAQIVYAWCRGELVVSDGVRDYP